MADQEPDSACVQQADESVTTTTDQDNQSEPEHDASRDCKQQPDMSGDSPHQQIETTTPAIIPEPTPEPEPATVSVSTTSTPAVNQITQSNIDKGRDTPGDQRGALKANPSRENSDRGKEDEKLAMYKALAIKLKKELVKSREELTKLRESSQSECNSLREKTESLERTLSSERQFNATTTVTLEAKVRTLQQQLDSTEAELQSLQIEFESYKVMASKVMQKNAPAPSDSNKTFEEERYKQLKELSDDQRKTISRLESQLELSSAKNDELSGKSQLLQSQLDELGDRLKSMESLAERFECLSNENHNLKQAIKQFRSKLGEPACASCDRATKQLARDAHRAPNACDHSCTASTSSIYDENPNKAGTLSRNSPTLLDLPEEGISPSASVKDESQTNSSSSHDGSTSGYVHIKPAATFELISRSSGLDDPQTHIDTLTKAYLDSKSANAQLKEQVRALKDELARFQRGAERLDLAENLEYLKNVVLKFLSLDGSQFDQKQRLIPVLSTVLKLSPDETAKLNAVAIADKPSLTSSFFKL